jgi:hypothetical protein
MSTPALDVLHTAALRLREAADRFIVAFEQAAAEALTIGVGEAEPAAMVRAEPAARALPRGRGREIGPVTEAVLKMAERPEGITAGDLVPLAASFGLKANTSTAAARLNRLADGGKLVPIRSQYSRYGSLRYFATAEAAETWAARQGPPPLDTPDAGDVATGPSALSAATGVAVQTQCVRPSAAMDGNRLAAMVEADAPAVAAALAVIAPVPVANARPIGERIAADEAIPDRAAALTQARARFAQPAPSAPAPKPYIPPTPTRARGERREQLTAAAFVAPVAKPEGEAIVPPTAKITKAPTPVDRRFYVDPEAVAQDGESFSAQWKRLRGEGAEA